MQVDMSHSNFPIWLRKIFTKNNQNLKEAAKTFF